MEYDKAIAGPSQYVESKEMSPPPSWRYFVNGEVPDNRAGAQGHGSIACNLALFSRPYPGVAPRQHGVQSAPERPKILP